MGFFKDFREDFSQAVNDLMPEDDNGAEKQNNLENDDMVVNTLDADMDTESELSKLNGLLEQVAEQPATQAVVKPQQVAELEREFTREVKRADVRTTIEGRKKMSEKKHIMTYEGVKKLEDELEYLKTVKRKEITEKIKVALGYGDLSEN